MYPRRLGFPSFHRHHWRILWMATTPRLSPLCTSRTTTMTTTLPPTSFRRVFLLNEAASSAAPILRRAPLFRSVSLQRLVPTPRASVTSAVLGHATGVPFRVPDAGLDHVYKRITKGIRRGQKPAFWEEPWLEFSEAPKSSFCYSEVDRKPCWYFRGFHALHCTFVAPSKTRGCTCLIASHCCPHDSDDAQVQQVSQDVHAFALAVDQRAESDCLNHASSAIRGK